MPRPSSAAAGRYARPAPPIDYQSMITGPRDPSSHGLSPKLDSSVLSLSAEGIAYKLVEPEDTKCFRIIETEEDKLRESSEVKSVSNRILLQSGKPNQVLSPMYGSSKPRAKFIPPNKHTVSRPDSARSSKNKENTSASHPKQSLSPKRGQDKATTKALPPQKQQVKVVKAPLDPKLVRSIEKMEISFEKNLGVIEKLYQEKLNMKSKIEELEERLGERREDGDTAADDLENALKVTKEQILREEMEAQEALTGMTATEAAKMFGNITDNFRPKSAVNRTSSEFDKSRKPKLTSSEDADIDRYVQKQLHLREKERENKLKQAEYEKYLEDRTLRASKVGKPYDRGDGTLVYPLVQNMLERNELAMKKSRDKFTSKYEAKQREEKEKRDDDRRKKRESLNKPPASLGGPTWRELQDMNEQKRQERVERRKAEWSTIPIPAAAQPRSTIRATSATISVEEHAPFTAQDPAIVAARLARQQRAFAEKQAEKKAAREQQKNTKYNFAAGTAEMEKRNENYAAKKKERMEKRKAEEDRKKREEEEEKMSKRPSLTRPPVESRRMSETTSTRAKLVRERAEAKNAAKIKEAAKQAAKEKRMKEVGKSVSAQIYEFDNERRSKPGYVSLKTSEELEIQNRKAREEFREKLRKNRKKISEAKQKAPSLISRHNASISKEKAHQIALEKLANAIGDTEDDKQGADILDDDEKMTIRASREGEYDYEGSRK